MTLRRRLVLTAGLWGVVAASVLIYMKTSPPMPVTPSGTAPVVEILPVRESPPTLRRTYTVRYPWGRVVADRRTIVNRNWYGYVQIHERGRDREIKIDGDRPIADQIIRPELVPDITAAIAAMLDADKGYAETVQTYTDSNGVTWRREP